MVVQADRITLTLTAFLTVRPFGWIRIASSLTSSAFRIVCGCCSCFSSSSSFSSYLVFDDDDDDDDDGDDDLSLLLSSGGGV